MRNLVLAMLSAVSIFACTDSSQNSNNSETNSGIVDSTSAIQEDLLDLNIPDTSADVSVEYVFNEEGYTKKFDLRAYIDDPDDDAPTNVRDTPNGKVVQKLPQGEDYMFNIIAQRDGWFQIADLISFSEEIEIQKTSGWIHSSVVGASTRFCCDEGVPLYKYPDPSDEFYIDQIPFERSIKIKELYADYALVEFKSDNGKKLEGWIDQEWICGNPVTTCP